MAAEVKREIALEIAHALFIDVERWTLGVCFLAMPMLDAGSWIVELRIAERRMRIDSVFNVSPRAAQPSTRFGVRVRRSMFDAF